MENVKELIEKGQKILNNEVLDKSEYLNLENFVLKNGSRLKKEPDFVELKKILTEIAVKFNLPTIENIQEGFGLNSCAQ